MQTRNEAGDILSTFIDDKKRLGELASEEMRKRDVASVTLGRFPEIKSDVTINGLAYTVLSVNYKLGIVRLKLK